MPGLAGALRAGLAAGLERVVGRCRLFSSLALLALLDRLWGRNMPPAIWSAYAA